MPGSILGTSVRRVEDRELITGASTYVGNLALPGLLHLAFVRSPMAHGRIAGIDTAAAAGRAGRGRRVHRRRPGPARPPRPVRAQPGAAAPAARHRPGALRGRSRRRRRGRDRRPPRSTPPSWSRSTTTRCPRSPTRRPPCRRGARAVRRTGSNLAAGSARAAAEPDPLADAEVVVRARIVNQRVAVMPMEGNAIAVLPGDDGDARADDLGLHPDAARLPRPGRRSSSASTPSACG